MKKAIAILLCMAAVMSLCGCEYIMQQMDNIEAAVTQSVPSQPKETAPSATTNPTAPTEKTSCNHIWGGWTATKEATCLAEGVKTRTCFVCHRTEKKTMAKHSHTESGWLVEKPAQVGVEGVQFTQCKYCKKRIQQRTIPALKEEHKHEISNRVIIREADCTNPSREEEFCSCGALLAIRERPAKGHSIISKTIAATATKGAHRISSCENCTYSYEEPIDFADLLVFESNQDGTCAVVGLKTQDVTDLVIPERSPAGEQVITIGPKAFKNCISLEYLVLPDTVINIMNEAFYGCPKLKTVVFPKNETQPLVLGLRCFALCGIEELELTETGTETIGDYAFYMNKSLKTVHLGKVSAIGHYAFYDCPELASLIHAGSLVQIGQYAFARCKKLTELRAKDSSCNLDTVEAFSNGAFSYSGIRNVVFSENLKTVGSAFEGCSNLGTVDFSRVKGKFASFAGSTLDTIIFPSGLTKIASGYFESATIEHLELPDSVVEIKSEAFCYATIDKLTFGSGLTTIGAGAFKDANITYDFSKVCKALTIGDEAFANNSFTTFAFPKSTVYIGEGALTGCNKLHTLSIPFIERNSEESTEFSTDCFAWLFGKDVDCWAQDQVVPKSLKTLIVRGENISNRDLMGVNLTAIVIGKDVTSIGSENFETYSCSLSRVYYEGTQQEWEAIHISTLRNQRLFSAEKYFYSETAPTTAGKFWHYNENGEIKIW